MAKAYRYRMPHNDYAGEVETHGFTAANATSIKPEVIPGFWPRWTGKVWEQIEDHRKRTEGGAVPSGMGQDATEYWLPGDKWDSPARMMVEVGPLPEGALLEKPEPTEAELCAMRIVEIKGELQKIDADKIRSMSAYIDGIETEDDRTIRTELNALAIELRAEMQMLEEFVS